jgi:hypothetical protein
MHALASQLQWYRSRWLPHALLWMSIVSVGLRTAAAVVVPPGFDEAYYFVYSLYPALSYFDHPPMVALCAGAGPWLTGVITPLTLRLCTIVLFSVDTILIYHLSRRWYGSHRGALHAAGLFTVTPLFFIISGISVVPDGPLVFFWLCTLLCIHHILTASPRGAGWWLVAGCATGAAFLSKYHGGLLGVMFWTYLLVYRRRSFLRPGPYVFALAALVVASPVFIWNMQHEWISFTFQGGRAIGSSIKPLRFAEALGGQALYCTPMLFIPFVVVMWRSFRRGIYAAIPADRLVFFFGTVPVMVFLGIALFRSILPHWTLPGYAAVVAAAGPMVQTAFSRSRWMRILGKATVICIGLVYTLVVLQTHTGILHLDVLARKGLISKREVRNDPTLDTYGWQAVPLYLRAHGVSPQTHMLCAHKWYLCGEIAFATKGRYPVVCCNENDPRGFFVWNHSAARPGGDAVCISTNRYRADSSYYARFFTRVSRADSIVLYRGDTRAKTLYLYHAQGFTGLD